ncbi:MAG: acyloxyacyl hydrolase [Parvularculaceae bacterium]
MHRIAGAAAALCFMAVGGAAAQSPSSGADRLISEIRGGVFSHDTGVFSSNEEDGIALNGEILFNGPDFLRYIGNPRPHIGGTWAVKDDTTSQAYFGLSWEADFWRERMFFYGSFGGAIHTGETGPESEIPPNRKALGCRVLFRESLGLGVNLTPRVNVAAHLDHISNARLCDQNEGLENAGVRFGYRF